MKTERSVAPLALYRENKICGKLANEEDFPPDLFAIIILMTKRLHQIGIYPEEEIIRFSIPKIFEMLDAVDVLSDISLSMFDTAQVVFGENYAAWWYRDEKQSPPMLYLLPLQLAFYHTKRADNYYLSLTEEGIDLRQNKVSVTNTHRVAHNIKKTRKIKLGTKGMAELKTAYHLLFIHLKYQILGKMEKLGYRSLIEKFAAAFCPSGGKEQLMAYANQYFALNTEKKQQYILAHDEMTFRDFFIALVQKEGVGIEIEEHSFADFKKWIQERLGLSLAIDAYCSSHFALLRHLSTQLKIKGFYLWLLTDGELLSDSLVLISREKILSELESSHGIEIIPFDEKNILNHYSDEILEEEELRKVAVEFYRAIGVADVGNMMMEILGAEVLDYQLYSKGYLAFFDWKEDDIREILYGLLYQRGLPDLIQQTSFKGITLDELYFQDEDNVSAYDRVILYAESIRKRGKLLFFLDTQSDSYLFGIIEYSEDSIIQFTRAMSALIRLGEIDRYVLFESAEKALFIELLANIRWVFDGVKLNTVRDAKEKAYRDNAGLKSREQIDKYLSRISLNRNEMTICFYIQEEDHLVDMVVKAENGSSFTNLDLLFQIHQNRYRNNACSEALSRRSSYLGHLDLTKEADKYRIILEA